MPNHDAISRMPWPERFWARIGKSDGCWLWNGNRTPSGYGMTRLPSQRKRSLAHRVSFVLSGGVIADGLVLDHLCNNPQCVNPAHLNPCTKRDNLLRSESPSGKNARKTHCPKGHALSGHNIKWKKAKSGVPSRGCRTCEDTRYKVWYGKNRDRMIAYFANYNANVRPLRAALKATP